MPDLFDLSHREAMARAREGAPIFLFVNPVEYHGPHLSLHNDRQISYGLAKRLAQEQGWPFIVAGHVEMGVDPCPGPGTQFSTYLAVRKRVLEACRALAELGVSKVILMTFHGAPLHNAALEAGAEWLRAQGIGAVAPFHLIVEKLVDLDDPSGYSAAIDAARPDAPRDELLRWLSRDMHAGFFETSLAMHLAPETVGEIRLALPPCPDIRAAILVVPGDRKLRQNFHPSRLRADDRGTQRARFPTDDNHLRHSRAIGYWIGFLNVRCGM